MVANWSPGFGLCHYMPCGLGQGPTPVDLNYQVFKSEACEPGDTYDPHCSFPLVVQNIYSVFFNQS